MNWFKKLWANPDVHIAFGTLSGVAATAFPQYAMPLAAVAAVLGVNGIVQPSVAVPGAVTMPSGASMHAQDYAALLATVAKVMADAKGAK